MTDTADVMSVATGTRDGGGRASEDRIVTAVPGAVVVLDGVSTVSSAEPLGGWYAQTLGDHLAHGLLHTPHADLPVVLETAIRAVAAEHGLRPGDSPAATVAIVRRHGTRIEALVLGDTPVLARTAGGEIHLVQDNRLAQLVAPRPETTEYRTWLRAGRGFQDPEHRALLQKLRAHQLRHLNNDGSPSAYWVAEADPRAAHRAVTRSWPADTVDSLLVMTDGVSAAVEEYGLLSWDALFDACHVHGPQHVVEMVHAVEESDPQGVRWPRYKQHDDKAIAHVTCIPLPEPTA
ncbi:hypothetical protein OK074_5124 [Actinobacteria bacterium OK074]|nr:hypothetical protein OK074_5124 [Actinobacteria bacterium OK074]